MAEPEVTVGTPWRRSASCPPAEGAASTSAGWDSIVRCCVRQDSWCGYVPHEITSDRPRASVG